MVAATKSTTRASTAESVKQLHYLAGALKAPRIIEAAERLADQARDAGWSFEDYLAAVLEREVSARNASGARLRIRAAGFGAPKTLEDFDTVYFYSDSHNDLPLMSIVSHPIATNPNATLKTHATAQGWALIELFND